MLQSPLREVEPTSTSHNDCGNKTLRDMFILEDVTLGNDSCNFCPNKIARQVERKIAYCNSALACLTSQTCQNCLTFLLQGVSIRSFEVSNAQKIWLPLDLQGHSFARSHMLIFVSALVVKFLEFSLASW